MKATRIQLLQEMAVFGAVRTDVLEFLLGLSRTVQVASGAYFFRQGDPGEVMFVLESGAVEVLKGVDGQAPRVLKRLAAGDCFGEMALMDLAPRSASVRAVEDCVAVSNHLTRVFAVEAVDFDRLEVSSPGLDRPLKHLDDFRRFSGRSAKIKLNVTIDGRKRFDGVIDAVDGGVIVFRIAEEIAKPGAVPRKPVKSVATMARKGLPAPAGVGQPAIRVPLESIDRARLIPEI